MRTNIFRGTGVAVITPFTPEGEVDLYSLRELINRLIAEGVDFLTALGTTAETPTLSETEQERIIEVFVETIAGRVPLLLGCGGNNTGKVCAFLENYDFSGIDGVLIVTPYYNKPSQEGLYQHYAAVAKSSPVPVMLYNVPGRTGVNLEPTTTLRLANDFENIVAIKEASGNIAQVETLLKHAPEGFDVVSGDDGITFELLSLGAVGVISVVANFLTAPFAQMVGATLEGDYAEGVRIHHAFHHIFRLAFVEGNPSGVKCMMALRGEVANVLRLPLVPVSAATEEKIATAVREFSI